AACTNLSEVCGQKLFAYDGKTLKPRRTREQDYAPQTFATRSDIKGAFFAIFANLGESLRLKAFCLWTQNSLAAKKNLHAPQIIFLLGVVLGEGVQGQPGAVQVCGEGNWKRLGKVLSHRRCKCRRSCFRLCWRNPSGDRKSVV